MAGAKDILAVAGLAAEIVFFTGVVFLLADLYGLRYVYTPAMEEDPMSLAPYVADTVYSYWPLYGIGFILLRSVRRAAEDEHCEAE